MGLYIFLETYKRQISIAYFFVMIGLVMGNWIARVPDIKADHELSDMTFGMLLVCSIVGGLLSFPVVGTIDNLFGSKAGVISGTVSIIVLVPIIGFPYKSIYLLSFGLAGLGFGWGILEVTINTQASLLEKHTKNHWIGFFQGMFSIGCLLGSLFGGVTSYYNISSFMSFVYIMICITPGAVIFSANLYTQEQEIRKYSIAGSLEIYPNSSRRDELYEQPIGLDQHNETRVVYENTSINTNNKNNRTSFYDEQLDSYVEADIDLVDNSNLFTNYNSNMDTSTCYSLFGCFGCNSMYCELFALCGISIVSSMADGSIGDWSTIMMTTELQMTELYASIGFSVAALMTAIGRIYSDHLRHHFGSLDLLFYSGLLASFGLFIFALTPVIVTNSNTYKFELRVILSYLSLFVSGAGISIASPILISMAGKLPGMSATKGIAMVTTPSYLGYLIGPPLIGFLSYSLQGLHWALLICSIFVLLIPLLCCFLERKNWLPSNSKYPSMLDISITVVDRINSSYNL